MNDIKIIPATEEHYEAIGDIAIAAWTPIREVFRRDMGDELYNAFFDGWQAEKRAGVIAQAERGRSYVALLDGVVVGFIAYAVDKERKTGEICGNAVNPEIRGKGIGPKMYDFVLDKMREEGAEYATVNTGLDDGHIPARRAYEKAGFEVNLPSIRYYMKL